MLCIVAVAAALYYLYSVKFEPIYGWLTAASTTLNGWITSIIPSLKNGVSGLQASFTANPTAFVMGAVSAAVPILTVMNYVKNRWAAKQQLTETQLSTQTEAVAKAQTETLQIKEQFEQFKAGLPDTSGLAQNLTEAQTLLSQKNMEITKLRGTVDSLHDALQAIKLSPAQKIVETVVK